MSTTSSKNFTTLYSGSGSVTPQGAYGNANVVSLLSVGTDGGNTVGNVTATGNVTADYFIGDGSQLTNLPAGNYSNANVSAYLASGTNTANIITTANISGAYLLGNGSQLTGINANYGNANVVSLLSAFGSNTISSTGNITTTANISGGYILGNGSQLTGIGSSYGNANVADFLANFGSNTVVTTGNISGGNISAAGNVNISGQGINVPGGFINATTHVAFAGAGAAFGSYNTGNTVGNALVYADGANGTVQIYSPTVNDGWIFSTGTGNLTLPGNSSAINYANGTSILAGIGGAYGNANVADFLANGFGSNTITTTGNITSGNVNTTGNIGSTQQTIIGTANATASATGNIVISGKNIATDVVFAPDVSTTSSPNGGRILIGAGVAGNTSLLTYDNNNQLRGTRLAVMDSYTKNNSSVVSSGIKSWQAITLDGNITAATSRIQGIGAVMNIGGGAAGNTYLPTHNIGVSTNGLAGTVNILNLGGATANLISVIGGNLQTAYATGTSSLMQFYGANSYTGNAVGFQSTMLTNNATANIRNAVGYSVSFADNVANTTGIGNTVGYLFPDQSTSYGASIGGSFTKGNLLAFLNVGNLAQVRLGSTLEQHYYAYPIATTTGNVTINAANGQVQTVTPTGAMAITDVTNLVTGAYNNALATTSPQSQSVTVQIRQGATGYAVTLPTTLGGSSVAYADGFNTVSTTAYSATFVTFYQTPSGVSGGSPFYVEVKTSDAGGGAAGSDGLIQFNVGGAANTGGRLGSTGNLFWTDSSQTLQTYNANVVNNLQVTGNVDVKGGFILNSNAGTNKTMTVSANAALSSSQARFGPTSLGLSNVGNAYVSTPNSAEFAPGSSGNFTVEAWVYPTGTLTTSVIVDTGELASAYDYRPQIFFDAGNVVYSGYNYTNDITYATPLTANVWTHVAAQRSSGTTTLFVNGANVGSFADSYNYNVSAGNVRIGATTYDAVPNGWNGYVDEFRWSNIARYSGSGFTVPSSPFATDSNTVLLLHFDGANGQTTTLDSSSTTDVAFADNINVNGDVIVSGQYIGSGASLTSVVAQSVNQNTRNYWANTAGSVGQIVCVNNSPTQAGKMAYWSTTSSSWRYIADDTAI